MKENYFKLLNFALLLCIMLPGIAIGQYENNKVLSVGNFDYAITVEKFVEIPDDFGQRARINSFTYVGNRIFVGTELGGKIYEITNTDGTYQAVLFMDLRAAIFINTGRTLNIANTQHGGLRSIAFHPDFNNSGTAGYGKFYTSVMEDRPSDISGHTYISDDSNIPADSVLLEWTYNHTTGTVDINSYREVFRVGMLVYDHPIKQIAFNRYAQSGDSDYGLLYITHGDGSVQSAIAGGGQKNDALGKVLRINPLESGGNSYTVPSTNPFVGNPSWLDELYAVGFRNPHHLAFGKDSGNNVHLIVADAGRDNIEEVNFITAGENYGWSEREGTFVHLTGATDPEGIQLGITALPSDDYTNDYTYPNAQWSHIGNVGDGFVGQAIAGGYVATSNTGEKLYFSSDFPVSGRIFVNKIDNLLAATTHLNTNELPGILTQDAFSDVRIFFDNDSDPGTPAVEKASIKDIVNDETSYTGGNRVDSRFGQDMDENLYIMNKRNGWIYKVQSITSPTTIVYKYEGEYSETNVDKSNRINPIIDGNLGDAYLQGLTADGDYSQFNIMAETAGNYEIKLRYSGSAAGTETMSLYINGTDVQQLSLPVASSSATDWQELTVTQALVAGINTIKFQKDSSDSGGINIDNMVVTPDTLSTEDPDPSLGLTSKVYPNPLAPSEKIVLSFSKSLPENLDVIIYSVEGRRLFSTSVTAGHTSYELDIHSYAYGSGMYFMELNSGHYKKVHRFIIN